MSDAKRRAARAMLLVFALLLVFLGWRRGEVASVLVKAIYICLECIGIG